MVLGTCTVKCTNFNSVFSRNVLEVERGFWSTGKMSHNFFEDIDFSGNA